MKFNKTLIIIVLVAIVTNYEVCHGDRYFQLTSYCISDGRVERDSVFSR